MSHSTEQAAKNGIAIVGMSGRFPGAASVAEFWENQLSGVEAISRFSVDELEVSLDEAEQQPNYVRARSVLDNADLFDPEFFGILPKEALLIDPQQRLFLECCWEAFEDAGCDPFSYAGAIGVIAGSSYSSYFLSQICAQPRFAQDYVKNYQIGNYPAMMGNHPDFLATRVAYKFNLRGPSFTIQAGCSTSLIAVCQACQSLLAHQSDMMLAGGVSITFPQKRGYFYQDGGMGSPDGHCRPFDADAQGTVFGGGVAVVALKRLEDAIANGDQIYSVIRGFATNNDGAAKVGYTAPSIEGQSNVIATAQRAAEIEPSTIGYIEAHGTATPLGDPIELAALTKAFRISTQDKAFCTVGTAKANVGHLDIAAGVTGLIHASHVVRHGKLPATLHFKNPTAKFDFANSPFRVNGVLAEWQSTDHPRRAGVSAFGVGGTNAHVVLEEAPVAVSEPPLRDAQLVVLSARSPEALDAATKNLAEYLKLNPKIQLADVAYTQQVGRRQFDRRRAVPVETIVEAVTALEASVGRHPANQKKRLGRSEVCFMFPGQGSQHANMGRDLYRTERVFREEVDRCADLLRSEMPVDMLNALFRGDEPADASLDSTQTFLAQPAIFTIEYALAKLWMSWGIQPRCMIGHSVGEFVAACLSGIFSLADALHLVATRGRLMQDLPKGDMLSVRMTEAEVWPLLGNDLSIAAVNAPSLCVVSGKTAAVAKLEEELTRRGIVHRQLYTSHAFHSAMMDPILASFKREVNKVDRRRPQIPYVSCVTGQWVTPEDVMSADYWTRHVRETVRFSQAISQVLEQGDLLALEVGPGNVLATLTRQHAAQSSNRVIVSSLADGSSDRRESLAIQEALGTLWVGGAQLDWQKLHAGSRRQRVSLPTYPFERKRFWLSDETQKADFKEEDEMSNTLVVPAIATAQATAVQEIAVQDVSAPTVKEVPAMIQPTPSSLQPRKERLRAAIANTFEDLSGLDISKEDSSATFLDLGYDSLFLTQVTQALQSKFGLKITFRQLLGDQSTLEALSTYVDDHLAPGTFEEPISVQAIALSQGVDGAAPMPMPIQTGAPLFNNTSGGASGSVEQLMRDQLQAINQLFAQQLSALRGGVTAPYASAAAAPAFAPQISSPSSAQVVAADAQASHKDVAGVELKGYTPFKPLQKSLSGDLTLKQQKHIKDLIERYTSRTATSKSKTQEYRHVLADPRVVAGFRVQWKEMIYPIITSSSKGSHLWDLDGNEYVDILNGFGPIMLGHRPSYVEEAIAKQLSEGFETGPQTLLAGEVAKAVCEMTGNERATFCNTGSEAVIAAMRVARTVTGKNRVVFFAGDYHGMFDEVLVKGFNRAGNPQSMPIAPGIPRESVANMTVLEYGTADSLEWIRAHAHELAAILVEPVQSRHPNLQPVEFLREIRKITEEADVCLVFDEVVTGFRVHPGGCQALFNIRADLATYGKVLAGGMPIGVLAGKARFMDALDGGMWQYGDDSFPETGVTFFAGTFVRHPLALAACAAVLKFLQEEGPGLQQRLTQRTTDMVARLNALLAANQVPAKIESFASIFYFSFPSDFRFGTLFYYHLRAKGIHLLEGFPCFLTTEHSDEDIDKIVRAFEETIAEMQAGEMLQLPSDTGSLLATEADLQATSIGPLRAPITESQMEILLSAQLSAEANCSYNESFSLHLRGDLNEGALSKSLSDLLARYDSLRAAFDLEGGMQHFSPSVQVELLLTDLSQLDIASQNAKFEELIAEDAHQPFDLVRGPLVRMKLMRFAPQRHALIFTSHHAVCDGWSINVLLNELSALYNSRVEGQVAELPPLMPFGEYAQAQQAHFAGVEGAEMEAYWVKQFEKLPPLLDLPIDRSRPALKSYHGATYRRKIDLATLKEIKQAGAQQKCTLFITLVGGFMALLSRLSGQEDVVVGVPVAGQALVEDKVLVGHCVNFVPVRGLPAKDLPASQFLQEVRKTVFDAYDHQNYTFGRLVRKLSILRDASRLPLLEVQFNLEKVGTGLSFSGLKVEVDSNPKSFVNFDLFLNAVEGEDGLTIDLDYNTDLLEETTVARWLDCYEELLKGLTSCASLPLSRLPLLTEAERDLVCHASNQTESAYPNDLCVIQLFEQQVTKNPHAVALQFEDQALTYAELNERVNRLARYLLSSGTKAGEVVGVYMERSLDMVVSLLATWKAGAAYVPLDPTFPLERLKMVFEDMSNPTVLTQSNLSSDLPSNRSRVIRVDELWPVIELQDPANLNLAYDSSQVAYVIYTSGSTGRPKGVEVTQSNVVNLLTSMAKTPGLTQKDVLVAVTTISFDIAALEIYLPLVSGAKLVVASRAVSSDGGQLLKLLQGVKATIMQATPVTFRLLLAAGWKGDPAFSAWCGGEALPRDLADEILKCRIVLWNMYGPTETTIWSAVTRVSLLSGPVLIGPPIDNTQFYVLDEHQQLVPTGVVGELFIGGDGVARGYYKRPDLTASRFINDPFSKKTGARLYRTGDLVRRLTNGEFEFQGRTDGQIKLRGFRIELGEIESALATHKAMDQAVVMLREDVPGDKRLVAYVIPSNGSVPTNNELRSYLLEKLPDYMVPSAYISLPSFPLTLNGKIDRRALPVPDWSPRAHGAAYVAPRTPQEESLAKIWAEVLHLERVGVEDNIFELGADSLHVFQIAARANQAGIDVRPRQILQYRSIAAVLADLATSAPASKSAPLAPVSRAKYRIVQPNLAAQTKVVDAGGSANQ